MFGRSHGAHGEVEIGHRTVRTVAGDSGDLLFLGLTHIDSSNGQSLIASDFSNGGSGDLVGAGGTVGLGEVSFDVATGASLGPLTVSLAGFPTTGLSDNLGTNLSFTGSNGTLTVVPESSMLTLCTIGLVALVGGSWRRKRRGIPAGGRP